MWGGANEAKVDQTTAMYFWFYSSKLETSDICNFVFEIFFEFFFNF